jgi:hypothetical protein
MQIPVVSRAEAKRFSKAWNYKGVALVIDDPLCQFAADFSNVVLKSFVESLIQEQVEAKKPKVKVVTK